MPPGVTVWLTGLPSAGKTTIATLAAEELAARGIGVELLDGDVVRTNLSKGLGFSKEDRDENVRRIGFVCQLLSRNGVAAIAAFISPYREIRDELRGKIENFVETYKTLEGRETDVSGWLGVDDAWRIIDDAMALHRDDRVEPEPGTWR
jgi:adenylylsulfate kinase-like enzyme